MFSPKAAGDFPNRAVDSYEKEEGKDEKGKLEGEAKEILRGIEDVYDGNFVSGFGDQSPKSKQASFWCRTLRSSFINLLNLLVFSLKPLGSFA